MCLVRQAPLISLRSPAPVARGYSQEQNFPTPGMDQHSPTSVSASISIQALQTSARDSAATLTFISDSITIMEPTRILWQCSCTSLLTASIFKRLLTYRRVLRFWD